MIKGDKKRKNRSGSKSQGTVPAFLLKTYEILEDPDYSDIISWNKEGNAFIVKRINDFSEKILPKYFKHNNFASFVRQLNMYDFHKSRHENNENEFRHKLFKRGQKHLLSEIKRKVSDGRLYPTSQAVATRDFDVDKFKKETTHLSSELGNVRRHQNDLEKVTKVIYNQNTQLIKENKLLWNELIKNREKYEKKVEKLMMFIFSIMHNTGSNQLGGPDERKALTNEELSQKLSEIANDPEQAKSFFNGNGADPSTISADRKDNEKFMQQMNNYFQNKGNEGTLDTLLAQIPDTANEELFRNQPEPLAPNINLQNTQNLDPNITPILPADKTRGKQRGRVRKVGPVPVPTEAPQMNEYGEVPTKQIKRENEQPQPNYNIPRNIFAAPEPINMMNGDSDNSMGRPLSNYGLGLSRDASFINSDPGYLRAPSFQQRSSNDFLYPNQKDELNLYNMGNFNNNMGNPEEKMGDMATQGKTDTDEGVPTFSPVSFMNTTSQNSGYNFGQPYDDTAYRG